MEIEKDDNKCSNIPMPPGAPPPPPPPPMLMNNNRLNELKKTIQENKSKNSNNLQSIPYEKPRDLRIPTVSQLQERLKNLKKIKN